MSLFVDELAAGSIVALLVALLGVCGWSIIRMGRVRDEVRALHLTINGETGLVRKVDRMERGQQAIREDLVEISTMLGVQGEDIDDLQGRRREREPRPLSGKRRSVGP